MLQPSQLCCRIGRTATVAFQMVALHARCHNLPRATGMRRGVNTGTAQRAGDGGRVYLANRHPRTQILKSVKSLESLYGADMMTGCLARSTDIPCERSSFQKLAQHYSDRSRHPLGGT